MATRAHALRRSGIGLLLVVNAVGILGAEEGDLSPSTGYGNAPALPAPEKALIPTINVAPVVGWREGAAPMAASGFAVAAFASGLEHPRWLHVLPNGDVLVAETNGPARPEDRRGLKGWFMKFFMKRAGAGAPSPDRITLLRDADGDGRAETRSVFAASLHSPFGMALAGNWLYVADTDALVRFAYQEGATQVEGPGEKVVDLPAGAINHHWTKNVMARPDGSRLYVTVGSNSNAGENGLDVEKDRAAILEVEPRTRATRIFASGLRNPNGMDWQPLTGALWTVVNERDELGDNLVPDYLTSVSDGGFYGWPYSYYGNHVDERAEPQDPQRVATALVPDYALGSHTASLGLAFNRGTLFPAHYSGGAFIAQHGSWNRRTPSGYRVIFVPFAGGRPSGMPEVVLSGFLAKDGRARGRPVGVALDRAGALLVADDVGNTIWRVTPEGH